MKILHVISSLTAGGAEKLVSTLARVQSEENKVGVFSFNLQENIFGTFIDSDVNYYRSSGKFYSFKTLYDLIKVIRNYDIIHVHLVHPLYIIGFLSLFFRKKKFIYTEHNSYNRRRSIPWIRYFEKFIYSRYDVIVCISKGVKENLQAWIGSNHLFIIIPNFIVLSEIVEKEKYIRKSFGFYPDDKLLIMVGRFSEAKDQNTLIHLINELPPRYKLILVGDGALREKSFQLTTSLKLENRIKFLGIRKDVYSILKMCDYGIQSSNWEGFGIAALEYMGAGNIALGTDVEGLNTVIPVKENLFNVGDFRCLAKRILAIEGNPELKQRIMHTQEKVLPGYDISKSLKLHQSTYESALGSTKVI